MRNLPDLAEALRPMVERAGSAIMRNYGRRHSRLPHKDDDSPLTLADLESQRSSSVEGFDAS